MGRYEEALGAYNEALKVRPAHAGTLNNKGLVLLELGRREEALEAFDEARRNL